MWQIAPNRHLRWRKRAKKSTRTLSLSLSLCLSRKWSVIEVDYDFLKCVIRPIVTAAATNGPMDGHGRGLEQRRQWELDLGRGRRTNGRGRRQRQNYTSSNAQCTHFHSLHVWTKCRLSTSNYQGDQMHIRNAWCPKILKIYMGTLRYNIQILLKM